MNERIRELAVQARKEYLKLPTGYRPEQVGMYRELMEKFAQLIVQDCVTKCDEVQAMYGQYTFTARKCKEAITEHFGVK